MGTGIWSMHFIAMLAFRLQIPVTYHAGIVLLSLLIAISASYLGLAAVARPTAGPRSLLMTAPIMGVAIAGMHYTGMAAMRGGMAIHYHAGLFSLSVAIAIVASAAALLLFHRFRADRSSRAKWLVAGSALVMGAAIAGMHYTGMAAAKFSTAPPTEQPGRLLPTAGLAFAVALATMLLLALALVAAFVERWMETRRKEYEANERLRLMIDALVGYAIYTVSMDGTITSWNASAENATGYSAEEAIGTNFARFGKEEDHERILGELDIAAKTGRAEATNVRRRREGREAIVHCVTTPLHSPDGEIIGFVRINRDITEQARAAEEIEAQREFLNALLNSIDTGIVACDGDGKLTLFNRATRELHGLPPDSSLEADDWAEHYDLYEADATTLMEPDHIPLVRALKGEIFRDLEFVVAPKGKTLRHLLASGQPIKTSAGKSLGAVIAMHDVTERMAAQAELREREEQLRQAQKMEAVGQLAAGVAHDFNNILTAIRVNAELLLMDMPVDAPDRENLTEITTAVDRAGRLTRQLLSFSRKQVTQPVSVNPNDVIESLNPMLRRLMVGDVELVTRLSPDLRTIAIDRPQLEQVIVNLAVNARDAMSGGGTLTIETAVVKSAGARDQALIAVTDTGSGMNADTQSRMFEPFFTTKKQQGGSGLGLATVYAITTTSGGEIAVTSAPGQGTSIRLFFPLEERFAGQPDFVESPIPAQHGNETVLVVDDEEALRRSVGAILKRRGYSVVEAASAREALDIATTSEDHFDLLLTDIMMPGMHGGELVRHFLELRPGTKILCMSGYADEEIVARGIIDAGIAFIQKPFAVDALAARVRLALDTAPVG